jgi:hypothetical protein
MSSSVRCAGIALLAVLAVVTPARAADSTAVEPPSIVLTPSTPSDSTVHVAVATPTPPPPPPARTTGSIPGRAGIGGFLGGSWIWAQDDYSEGALPRFNFAGTFRYQMKTSWRLQISPGFTWNAYTKHADPPYFDPAQPGDFTKQHYLTLLLPMTAQIQWTRHGTKWFPYAGIGPGIYRVQVEHDRDDLLDPITFAVHRGLYLGATVQVGTETYMKGMPNVSVDLNLTNHFIAAKRDDQFPAGWNSGLANVAVSVGMNYYFDLGRMKKKEPLPLPGK